MALKWRTEGTFVTVKPFDMERSWEHGVMALKVHFQLLYIHSWSFGQVLLVALPLFLLLLCTLLHNSPTYLSLFFTLTPRGSWGSGGGGGGSIGAAECIQTVPRLVGSQETNKSCNAGQPLHTQTKTQSDFTEGFCSQGGLGEKQLMIKARPLSRLSFCCRDSIEA